MPTGSWLPTAPSLPTAPWLPIERASANDMGQRAAAAGEVPIQVGAALILGPGLDVERAMEALGERVRAVPRLRQRLVSAPFGCGRPVWVDDPGFRTPQHIVSRRGPDPGDDDALLRWATTKIGDPLPSDRPPWSATFLTGMTGGRTALVVVFDHVMADGLGGLALLVSLVDGAPPAAGVDGFPRPAPPGLALARDAAAARWRALGRWRSGLEQVRAAVAEVRPGLRTAPATSLNRPTGTRRSTALVSADLEAIRSTAHRYGGTVNDAVLAAATGALHRLLSSRGEAVDRLVVSIPVSARRPGAGPQLGNQVGVVPVDLPAAGDPRDRIAETARITRAGKAAAAERGSSAFIVGSLFRGLKALGLLRWVIDRQRLVNTLVTNVRGPDAPVHLAGTPVEAVIPLTVVTGNITVGFAVLSYLGRLTVVVNADSDACPDLDVLITALEEQVGLIEAGPGPGVRPAGTGDALATAP